MTTVVYCASCDTEADGISFKCLECESTYCEQCVGKAKDYGNGVLEFRCDGCGNELLFSLPMPTPATLTELLKGACDKKEQPIRSQLRPRKRASRPSVVKPEATEGDDSK